MILHQKIEVDGAEPVGDPGPLPLELQGLADESLADLSWADPSLGFAGFGLVPVEVPDRRPTPDRRTKVEFWRLFTADEENAFNRARRRVSGLTDADYEDPAMAGFVALERFLNRFDATDIIELDHQETQDALDLLVALSVLAAERAEQAKLGERP